MQKTILLLLAAPLLGAETVEEQRRGESDPHGIRCANVSRGHSCR